VNSQQLLYINIGIVIFLVLYFTIGRRKGKDPVRLNLHKGLEKNKKLDISGDFTQLIVDKTKGVQSTQSVVASESIHLKEESSPLRPVVSGESDLALARDVSPLPSLAEEAIDVETEVDQKSLNFQTQFQGKVYFVYNGHEWECHEVLGIPCGSTLHVATEMYQHLIKTSDPSTFEFYEAAYRSILKRKSETKI
jgi:hypothetical protein